VQVLTSNNVGNDAALVVTPIVRFNSISFILLIRVRVMKLFTDILEMRNVDKMIVQNLEI